jgi:DNA-binding Xre family transcriptional regulator
MTAREQFSTGLRVVMAARNLGARDVAQRAGVTEVTIRNICNEAVDVKMSTVGAICEALGVYPSQIMESGERFGGGE